MPRVPGRLARLLLSVVIGTVLAAVPAAALADPVVKFSEHFVSFECFLPTEEGEIFTGANSSSEFGSSAFVDAPGMAGSSESVTVVESGGGATIEATIPLFDPDGNPAGEAVLSAVLTPTGATTELEPFREGNRWIKTTGTIRDMVVTGSLALPEMTLDLSTGGCFGAIGDIDVHETQPHAFVLDNEGIVVDCHWETADAVAGLFVIDDNFGPFADAFLITSDHDLVTVDAATITLTQTSLAVDVAMFDVLNEAPASASATATLSPVGDLVESTFLSQSGRTKLTEQLLAPDGTLEFSTGEVFTLDAESCFISMFDTHIVDTAPQGPKPGGSAPAHDTPEGAVPIPLGGVVNDQTRGTAVDPEIQVTACPEDDDRFGHTLWYTFTGTGGPLTIDTAGSNFDTVIAVYDASLTLLACNDDVLFDPIGGTFQAALTLDTVEGATYYVQAGGFDGGVLFGEPDPDFGRLRIRIG